MWHRFPLCYVVNKTQSTLTDEEVKKTVKIPMVEPFYNSVENPDIDFDSMEVVADGDNYIVTVNVQRTGHAFNPVRSLHIEVTTDLTTTDKRAYLAVL